MLNLQLSLQLRQSILLTALFILIFVFSFTPAAMASELKALSHDSQCSAAAVSAFSLDDSNNATVVAWKAENEKAILVAVHGFGLHKCAFKQFAEAMKSRGISTYAIDVRGFGSWAQSHSSRRLSFKSTLNDLQLLISSIKKDSPQTPIFLMGESMGGAIALHFAAQYPNLVDGVIASVPGAERYKSVQTSMRLISAFIFNAGGDINVADIVVNRASNNQALKELWRSDEQAKFKMSLSEILRFNGFMKDSHRLVKTVQAPVLLVQGEKDHLVRPVGSQKLFAELASPDKQLMLLKNGEHLTFEEGQFDQSIVSRVDSWIDSHIYKNELVASQSLQ